jgi:hypothetical protein
MVASLQQCVVALVRARQRSATAVSELNRLHKRLQTSQPATEAERCGAVAELDAVYVTTIARSQEERVAVLRCLRTLEELANHDGESGRYSAASVPLQPSEGDGDGAHAGEPSALPEGAELEGEEGWGGGGRAVAGYEEEGEDGVEGAESAAGDEGEEGASAAGEDEEEELAEVASVPSDEDEEEELEDAEGVADGFSERAGSVLGSELGDDQSSALGDEGDDESAMGEDEADDELGDATGGEEGEEGEEGVGDEDAEQDGRGGGGDDDGFGGSEY